MLIVRRLTTVLLLLGACTLTGAATCGDSNPSEPDCVKSGSSVYAEHRNLCCSRMCDMSEYNLCVCR